MEIVEDMRVTGNSAWAYACKVGDNTRIHDRFYFLTLKRWQIYRVFTIVSAFYIKIMLSLYESQLESSQLCVVVPSYAENFSLIG